MLTILAPFYEAMKMLSGVSYAMLNIVCCTMHYFKKTVAPPNDQDEDYYAELLYEKLDITASQSSSTNVYSDDKIVDLAGCVDQALSISNSYVQKHKNILVNSQQNSDSRFKKHQAIELPVTITNMLEWVKATIYLSMCQYWNIPKKSTLILALLDPRYKKLKFVTETQCDMAVDKLNELYQIEQSIIMEESNDDLYNNPPKLLLTNEQSNVNQVNYSLIGLSDDSDEEESNMSNEVNH
ncbi:zinc finger bed domain-containing protein 1-like [Gigaspora margarita]|uniref:Zinc finger bed domain-containing protein 1-like n=1 Tax=Gigaspora margarita TaxID=4874 RepID=A0A8H3XAQ7_GIGMA|nr:zinc finger bed domain-containing protein 1-like [Gigaspora margarita]